MRPRNVAVGALGLGSLGLAWSRGDVPRLAPLVGDLHGRVAIVTGANSGIGKETAAGLGAMGATVVMACRSLDRGQEAAEELREGHAGIDLRVMRLDLADLEQVREFAAAFLTDHDRLDILVNNAGRVVGERQLSTQGHEATLATNHLGPFLLTGLLLDCLVKTGRRRGGARIVNVASSTHRQGRLDLDDLMWEQRPYRPLQVYATTKLMNVMTTLELAGRTDPDHLTVNCLHPGNITTSFGQDHDGPAWIRVLMPYSKQIFLTPRRGADTSLWLASADEVQGHHGGYFYRRRAWQPSTTARDRRLSAALWERSQELVGGV